MKLSAFFSMLVTTLLLAPAAFAHPGTNTLTCTAKNGVTAFRLHRFNSTGWMAPLMDVTYQGKTYNFRPEDEENTFGETIHDSPMGIIYVTAGVRDPQYSNFTVKAIPQTVQAFDMDGNPVKWDLQKANDECSDSNGKAKFQGVFKGYMQLDSKTTLDMDAQIMDCELEYNSGMAC